MTSDMKNFHTGVFTLKFGEVVLCDPQIAHIAYFYCVINAIGLQVVVASTDSMDIARGILRARR